MAHTDSPIAALQAYVEDLKTDYYPWYLRATNLHSWLWAIGQGVAIVASLSAALVAALTTQQQFAEYTRGVLVVLPLVGTFASSLVLQTKVRELLSLRERGRERIQTLISMAQADFADAHGDDKKVTAIHKALVESVSQLEREQSLEFFAVAPGSSSKGAVR
jgi:hypothetical protein